jgi:hypothetical protein
VTIAVEIKLKQTRTIEEGPIYKVKTEVTEHTDIEAEIFVFSTETQNFEHVATVWDMEHYPKTREEALEAHQNYYRLDEATVGYETQVTALEFAEYTVERVQFLVTDYSKAITDFEGEFTYTLDPE